MACSSGTPNCTVTHSSDSVGVLSGYAAAGGFDPAAGLGSLNVANVVDAWRSSVGTASATVTVTPAANSFPLSQSLNVTVAVRGASGTPTGNVGLSGGGSAAAGTLSGGTATVTIPAYSLTPGNDTLTAHYSGDATYARATGTASISVVKATPTVTLQPSLTQLGANDSESVNVVVAGGGTTPTGTVTVSVNSYTSLAYTLSSGSLNIAFPSDTFVNGTNTITASYSGDAEYTSGTGTTTVTATILIPTLQVVPSVTSLSTSDSMKVTVNVTGTGPTPTGIVTLNPFSGTLSNGSYTFTTTPDFFIPGTDTLTVSYWGDNTYRAESATASVTVSISPTSLTVTPSATSLSSNQSLTLTGQVVSAGGNPSGSVTVSGGGYTGFAFGFPFVSGQYSLTIPPGSLSAGTDTFTVNYSGDAYYLPSSTTTTVTVTQFVKITPSLTITPSPNTIGVQQPLNVMVAVSGTGGPATGTVTVSSGSYNSGPSAMSGGSATVTVPGSTFSMGTATFNVSYGGDPTYLPASGTGTVTVVPSTFSISAGPAAATPPGINTESEITISSTTGYTGLVSVACALTSSPSGAKDLPTCSPSQNQTVQLAPAYDTGYIWMGIFSTAPSASLARPSLPGSSKWTGAGGIGSRSTRSRWNSCAAAQLARAARCSRAAGGLRRPLRLRRRRLECRRRWWWWRKPRHYRGHVYLYGDGDRQSCGHARTHGHLHRDGELSRRHKIKMPCSLRQSQIQSVFLSSEAVRFQRLITQPVPVCALHS